LNLCVNYQWCMCVAKSLSLLTEYCLSTNLSIHLWQVLETACISLNWLELSPYFSYETPSFCRHGSIQARPCLLNATEMLIYVIPFHIYYASTSCHTKWENYIRTCTYVCLVVFHCAYLSFMDTAPCSLSVLCSLIPRPCPEKSEEGLVTLAPFPVTAESAVLILGRPITFVHFQLLRQLRNSVRHGKLFTG